MFMPQLFFFYTFLWLCHCLLHPSDILCIQISRYWSTWIQKGTFISSCKWYSLNDEWAQFRLSSICNFLLKKIFSNWIWCLFNTEILNFKIFWQKVFIIIVILYSWNNFHDFMCFFYNLFCLENSLRILYKVECWYLFIFFGMIETVSISLQCWPKIPTIWCVVFPIKYKKMKVKSIEKDLPNSR